MQTLDLAMTHSPDAGEPLPSPFKLLGDLRAHHRRGQVSIVAAGSNGGKSAYAAHVAVHGKSPGIYFSADLDKITFGIRVLAGVLDVTLEAAETLIRIGDHAAYSALKEACKHLWFCWDSQLTLRDIQDEVEAYALTVGEWPHLIVVDNLINIDPEGEAGHQQKDGCMQWLQQLANVTNAHVMVLHHVTGAYEDGLEPIPKSALLDKVAKRPKLVLTLHKVDENLLGIRVVKNSFGKSAADASYGVDVAWMPNRSWFRG